MSSSSVLGTLVVRIAAELRQYKADMAEAGRATQDAATKIEQSTGQAGGAAGKLGEKLGAAGKVAGAASGDFVGAAQGAQVLAAGAGAAAVGVGLLVAAAAAAAYAAHVGAQEQKAYEKALILTGNAAGTNASQMQAMAASIDKFVGTQYEAAAALAQMAGTGQVAAGNLEKFSQTAIEMERTVGQKVGDTVKVFAELGEAPVKASLKLNESMNYLTASTFAQIKAAEDLGDKERAASLAQNAYADAMKTRTAQIEANLGLLERAWRGVGAMGKWAWDQMLGIGRTAGPEQALEGAKKAVANLETLLAKGGTATPDIQRKLDAAKQNLSLMQENVKLSERASQSQADQAASEKAKIAWLQEGDKYLSKREKAEQAIARIRSEGAAAGASELEIEKRVAIERAKGADKPAASKRVQIDENEKLIASIRDGMAATQAELDLGQKLTPVQKEIATLYAKISSSKAAYTVETLLTVDALMQEKLADEQANTVREAGRKALELATKERQKAIDVIEKDTASLQDQIRKQQDANASIGLSKRAIAELTRQRELDAAAMLEAKAIKELDRNLDYEKYEATMAQVRAMRELANLKGEGGALQAIHDETRKAGEEWKKFTDDVERGLTDSLFRAFESGKGFFDSLWSGIKNLFKTTVLKLGIQAVVGGVTGALGMGGGEEGGGGLLGMGKNLMSMNSGWLTDFGATAVGQMSSTGAKLFSQGFESLGSSMMDTANSLAQYSDVISGAGDVLGYAGVLYNLSQGNYGAAIGGAIGTYFLGPIGGAIGSWLGGLLDGDGKPASKSTGDTTAVYDSTGKRLSTQAGFGHETEYTQASSDAMQRAYAAAAAQLGIKTVQSTFGTGGNSDGETTHFAVGSSAGGKSYQSADNLEYSKEAYSLEASRAVLAALQGSELPRYLSGVFDNITAGTATQEQITNILNYAGALKQFDETLKFLPFDNLREQSYGAMEGLIAASGGLEKLQGNLGFYFQNFYGESERAAAATASLAAEFAKLGIAVPDNAAQLRDLIAAQDISTEAGRNMAASLLGLAPAFYNVAAAARASAQQMMSVMANYASADEQRAYQLAQIQKGLADGGVNVTVDQLGNLSRDQAWKAYKDAVAAGDKRSADAIFGQLDAFAKVTTGAFTGGMFGTGGGGGGGNSGGSGGAADSIKSAWKSITDSIWGEVKRIRELLAGTGAAGYAQAQAKFAIALAQARAGDQDAAKSLPELSRNMLTLADDNVSTLIELQRIQGRTANSLEGLALEYEDKYSLQTSATNANTNALLGLTAAMRAALGLPSASNSTTPVPTAANNSWLAGLNLPSFDVGTNYVPRDMLALIHAGEEITPRAYNPAAGGRRSGGGDNSELIAEVRALRAQIADLQSSAQNIDKSTGKTKDVIVRVTHDGQAMQMEPA